MTSPIRTEREGNVLVIISDNPPVNALSHMVRAGLADAVAQGIADPKVEAMIIRCDGQTFFAGADITEFGKPPQGPSLPEVLDRIEACDKPVIAAIHGSALGGGCEVALACHYRLAVQGTKFGLPEVTLGLIPGAAGTQRLPRLVGAKAALSIIVLGNPVSARDALDMRLIDALTSEGSLMTDALIYARSKVGLPVPRASNGSANQDGVRDPAIFDEFRATHGRALRGLDAPNAAISAVRLAGELPFHEGVKRERELFAGLMTGAQSKAMRHYFFAERAANKITDLRADTQLLPIGKVGVIGAGTMGGGIAMNFLSAGIPVTILEMQQDALDRGTGIMRRNYEGAAKRGRMTGPQVDAAIGLLTPTLDYADLTDCDLVIEAVYENMDVKKQVFARLDDVVKPEAILASNTSYLNIDEIATATKRPGHVLGLHFFSPANVMKLLEVVRGAQTRDDVLATAMKLARTIGKVAAVSGVCPGFIGNRMLSKRQAQANKLIMEGATYWDVDDVLLEFGFPMGPFQMGDLAGLDIGWHRDPTRVTTVREALCAAGRFGQKAGKGFYDYDAARQRTPSEDVRAIIADFAAKTGNAQRTVEKDEIRERLLYPMVNEGAMILSERIAQRASDIDVVWINGYGWPVYTGGPMFWASNIGLNTVVAGLDRHGLPVSDYLRDLAGAGRRFD
jgi:3-hydroxyacyl-CoA dehydrogenase